MEGQPSSISVKTEGHSSPSSVPILTVPRQSPENVPIDIAEESLEQLEQNHQSAVYTLGELDVPLAVAKDDSQAALFLDRAKELLNEAPTPQTIIGVVGPTGSGKSSVINAVLREEYLVPTSCVRACTAAVTEISWNHSDDPDELYRAEIEFLTVEEWDRELELFCGGLVGCSGDLSGDFSSVDESTGIAWEKMRAVYPRYTRQELANASTNELASLPEIRNVIGTTKNIAHSSCKSLHDELLQYIDSKDKNTGTSRPAESKLMSDEEDLEEEKELVEAMALWPLIKVVKVFTKSDALSTGGIIVDLPGSHDSNAARAAVADNYLQRCSNIWIVAPITRAVDDKTAQNLLGRAFRTQLQYDGAESKITFICTKTDDISLAEATRSLRLDSAVKHHDSELNDIEAERTETTLKREELLQQEKDGKFAKNETERSIRVWKLRRRQVTAGKVVYAPKHTARKRKSKRPQHPRPKRSSVFDSSSDDSSSSENASEEETDDDDSLGEPLTKEKIQQELDQLQTTEIEIRENGKRIKREIKELRALEKDLKKQEKWSDARLKFVCIQARSNYSRHALQQHYAAGIREMDQETAEQENEELAVPGQAHRDYTEVAKSLKVFCVSSWDYQRAPQRHKEGKIPPDFDAWDETEVPQLQQHTKQLTEENRIRHCKRFRAKFLPMLQALKTWCHERVDNIQLAEGEKKVEADWIDHNLRIVKEELQGCVIDLMKKCRDHMDQHLFNKKDSLIRRASNTAADTARAWGDKGTEGPSLPWITYKAVCRYEGDFTGRRGRSDFNQDLVQPLLEDMRGPWQHLFRVEIPDTVENFPTVATEILQNFDGQIRKRIKAHPRLSVIRMDSFSAEWYIASIKGMAEDFGEEMETLQKETSRKFEPSIAKSMHPAYDACVKENGPGSFARMKEVMKQHVSDSPGMFTKPLKEARHRLISKCNTAEKEFLLRIDSWIRDMKSEYYQAIIGRNLSEISKNARVEVSKILARADKLQGSGLDEDGAR